MTDDEWDTFLKTLSSRTPDVKLFMDGVEGFFASHPSLNFDGKSILHSIKKRMKDANHLREKIDRKNSQAPRITPENLFGEVTDIAGVRLFLLFQSDFAVVDAAIRSRVSGGDWVLREPPIAFTWDPETRQFFEKFDLKVEQRETKYTSVHYLLKPRKDSDVCCEVQVRTLFEEIWGEVDHMINYPTPTSIVACREQLMVLSKIVGAGSRLLDSIQRTLSTHTVAVPTIELADSPDRVTL